MSETVDLLLVNGIVVSMNAAGSIIPDGAVAIRGRDIVALGPAAELTARFTATETRDCRGCAIIPGLINGHAHVPMSLLRGLVADQQLDVWLYGYMFPVESQFVTPEFSYVGTLLSCVEMIRGGTTTFVDMYYFEEEVARAAEQAGMRAICGQTVMRLPTPDAQSFEEGLERAKRYMQAWQGHERITPTIAPHAPYTCTDEIYREAAALCQQYKVPMHTHLSETAREVRDMRGQRQLTPISYAEHVGAFEGQCIAAHCVHATEEDILLLREHGVGVVPCPSSNLKLASGFAPYRRFLQANVRTGLGTDGPASNDDQDMFAEIHLAALLPKGVSGDPTAVSAREAFSLATSSGARAIHLDHIIGSLTPGKRADITIVELGRPHSAPRYTYSADAIYSHLVYSARSGDVRDVLINGQFVLRDRQLLTLDEADVLAQAQRLADKINTFLSGREANLLDKIAAIGNIHQDELFEIQSKARLSDSTAANFEALLDRANLKVSRSSQRTQFDTYFLWNDPDKGRIRLREDQRQEVGASPEASYTITLTSAAVHGEFSSAILLGRARYTAPANRTLRFYREYFQPDRIIEIEKHRRRWHVKYKGADFAINVDTLIGHRQPGPYLEIKSRTWSRNDAIDKTALIGELLEHFGVDEQALLKHEYVDL